MACGCKANLPKNINLPSFQSMKKPYFKEDNFCLYQGDCREILKQLPDNSIDMVFADPPYFLSNGGFTVHAGKMVKN